MDFPPPHYPATATATTTTSSSASFSSSLDSSPDDYSKICWNEYFDEKKDILLDNGDSFCCYCAGSSGPTVLLLHGGGHTSLTWSLTAKSLKAHCRVIAIDFRGHGETKTSDDLNLSTATLVQDTIQVLQALFPVTTEEQEMPSSPSELVMVGHSMGGAMAVHIAIALEQCQTKQKQYHFHLIGLMVVDVVEGTAIAALHHMKSILAQRPVTFSSEAQAVKWSVQTGVIKNIESARVSMPSQLIPLTCGSGFGWRTKLESSATYWKGWFEGLSECFLNVKMMKVLVLAGTDRLDTPLSRGQMQGKFQLLLMYGCGHVIQEDNPTRTAEIILTFCQRVCLTPLMNNPMPSQGGANDLLQERLRKARNMVPTAAITGTTEYDDEQLGEVHL